jgi:3D (Asp-Asp-Asp) domain-containing protein
LAAVLLISLGATVAAQQATEVPPVTVTLTADGETREVLSTARTVKDLLEEHQIKLDGDDRCSVPLSTPVQDGLSLTICRVRTETVVERTPISFPRKQTLSRSLRAGATVVKVPGKEGERAVTYRDYYKDGTRTARDKVAEKVTPPTTQVETLGTRGLTLASRSSYGGRRIIEMLATGYGPSGNGPWGRTTTSGIRSGYGVVAVDPRFIRLGTHLYIEGYGHAVAGDTGSAIRGNRIDLGFDHDHEAARVGRRRVRVLIMD